MMALDLVEDFPVKEKPMKNRVLKIWVVNYSFMQKEIEGKSEESFDRIMLITKDLSSRNCHNI